MGTVSDVTESLGGPLGWINLIKEGLSIILFLTVWYVFAGFFHFLGLLMWSGVDPNKIGQSLISIVLVFFFSGIGWLIFLVSNYIVIMRVLGKSIALALKHADVEKVVQTKQAEG